jgi:hypothetical protein
MSWREFADLPAGMQVMPVERGERKPGTDMTGTRRSDGVTYSLRKSLGLPAEPPADDSDGVVWTPWPP